MSGEIGVTVTFCTKRRCVPGPTQLGRSVVEVPVDRLEHEVGGQRRAVLVQVDAV